MLTNFKKRVIMQEKEKLIKDIQNLLNTHGGIKDSTINVNMLEFMDKASLISIIELLLDKKDSIIEDNMDWLNSFKNVK